MLEIRYLSERSLCDARGARLLRYLLDHGADEFSISVMALQDTPAPFADAFEHELGQFERPEAVRRVLVTESHGERARSVRLWTLDAASLERLLSFFDNGLFDSPAGPDGWFEDLIIYRRGELIFGLVSHQREGALRLQPDELAQAGALGISLERTAESIGY